MQQVSATERQVLACVSHWFLGYTATIPQFHRLFMWRRMVGPRIEKDIN
jgi:hypothetical protein